MNDLEDFTDRMLKQVAENFVEEDSYSCDRCKYCWESYGNVEIMKKRNESLTHDAECEVLLAQRILKDRASTGERV